MTGNTDIHLLVTDTLKKVGAWIRIPVGTRCRTLQSSASQTCSIGGDMSGEYAGHGRTGTFSASRNCVQIHATWGHALSC